MHNMVKCQILQLRCYPLLFCNFTWFDSKAALAHHPIIRREVGELVAKGAIDQWMHGAGFLRSKGKCSLM